MGDEPLPEGAVLGVAGVELGGLGARGVLDGLVAGLDPILGQAVEPRQLGDGVGFELRFVAGVLPAPEDHAELRAPVAQVVVADDLVPERRDDAREGSPMTVERRWPTCIGLATLGEEKSMTTVRG